MSNQNELVSQSALAEAKSSLTVGTSLQAVKEAEEIRIAMASAKWYPRNLTVIEDKIIQSCGRQRLAETAQYSYPRGGTDVSGPSIKLVEVITQCYQNIQSGIKELQRYDGYSECEAFAWDLENNVKIVQSFTVPHSRDTKSGSVRLKDDRDIREMIANYGARNRRSCLERVIPRDLIELGLEICQKTLQNDTRSLQDRIKDCKLKFKDTFEVNGEFLEKLAGEKSDNWTNSHLKKLGQYFTALKEGNCTIKDLESNFIAKISGNQIKELAKIIGTDEVKIAILKDLGFVMSEIKNIPAMAFDSIKNVLSGKKADAPEEENKTDDKV